MNKHTPGPWRCVPWFDEKAVVVTGAPGKDVELVVAKVEDRVGSPDARLIAAAPDLLTACQRVLSVLDTHFAPPPVSPSYAWAAQLVGAREFLRKTIAEATGESTGV